MKISIEVELLPFTVPDYVEGVAPLIDGLRTLTTNTPRYALSMLDAYALDRLCSDFYNEVFKKAGKSPPPKVL